MGIPVGFSMSSTVFFSLSSLFGMNILHIIMHSALLVLMSIYLHFKNSRMAKIRKIDFGIAFFLVFSAIFSYILTSKFYLPKPMHFSASVENFIHEEISLINSFVHGANCGFLKIFKINHPYCYKCVARTKWVTALHSAILIRGGASLSCALNVPTFLLTFAFSFLFLKFSNMFLDNIFYSLLSLVAFFFAGGLYSISLLWSSLHQQKGYDFVYRINGIQTEWYHPVLHYYMGMRSSQMVLSLSIVILHVLIRVGDSSKNNELFFIGLLLGVLPSVQFSGGLGMILYSCGFFYIRTRERILNHRGDLLSILLGFFSMFVLVLPLYFPKNTNMKLITRQNLYGPLIPRGIFFAPIVYWLESLGVFSITTLLIGVFFMDEKTKIFYIPSLIAFLFGNFFKTQTLLQYNISYFYPSWMLIASIIHIKALAKLADIPSTEEKKGITTAISICLYILSVSSGIIGFVNMNHSNKQLWTEQTTKVANWIISNTNPKSVFYGPQEMYNPITVLSGRILYTHSERMLQVSGHTIDEKQRIMAEVMKNCSFVKSISKLQYILSKTPFKSLPINSFLVYQDTGVYIYQNG